MKTYPASEQEAQLAASAFIRYQKTYQDECACCLDAEVDVAASVSAGWFSNHSGKISGYLQAMEQGYIKFIVPNPLGQPIFIFLTDGEFFKALYVLEGKAYLGSVNGKVFKKFAPPGFDPEFSYYWLTGRLPPGDINILKVSRDKEQDGYWLQVRNEKSGIESMVLFDPLAYVVLRHIIMNDKGHDEVDVIYEDYQPGYVLEDPIGEYGQQKKDGTDSRGYLCRVPTKISIISNSGANKKIDLKFYSFIPDAKFSQNDFELEIPDNLKKLKVK